MPGLFGGSGGGNVASQAAGIQAQGAQQAAQIQQQMFQQALANVAPWLKSGQAANTQQAGLLGLPGYTAVDPTATLQATPGYQWGLSQGVKAGDLSAASKGLALSGAQQKGLQSYGQNYGLQTAWNPYMQSLQNLSGQGLSAGNMGGNWGMQTGQAMGQDYMAAAQAQAQGLYNQYYANQQGNQGWGNLLGMGLGIGSLFGGGGGGGASSYGNFGQGWLNSTSSGVGGLSW